MIRHSLEIKFQTIEYSVVWNFCFLQRESFFDILVNSLIMFTFALIISLFIEYEFYHLLPDDMKFWFVMPFNYQEKENSASYTMERLYMTDLAIKWVHGSMDENEFGDLMDKYFYFFKSRHTRKCTELEYMKISDTLYIDKVKERISSLKVLSEFSKIGALLDAAGDIDIDVLLNKYLELKCKVEARVQRINELVIGHGDPCFANTLYNKSTKTLKFIDPKGAIEEKDL